ncbi:MAG TPA: hypothetical protein PKW56_02355 [Clostridiales bacterium]|nr:hypothetical protein [Clostridiales bacterium]
MNTENSLNPAAVFLLFISSAVFFSLNRSFTVYAALFSSALLFLFFVNKTRELFLLPLLRYKVFLIFSFSFSIIISSDLNDSLLLFLRFTVLILMSVWLNYFVDFKNLLAASEKLVSYLPSPFIRDNLKKIFFSSLLGMEFCVSLISQISKKPKNKSNEAENTALIKKNISLLVKLFLDAFSKAAELEDEFTKKNISSFSYPKYVFRLRISDYFILTLSIILLFLTFLKL